ncbi:MAG TPA: hypothetical protein VNR11_18915 [Xanthobacteraceae bacterium]|nr:hypothetical protein [Xanthobacteraceae bacterium]
MKRVIALLAGSAALSACSSLNWSTPSFDLGSFGGGRQTVNVRVESEPQGAEAKGPTGNGCRTPCTLAVPANSTTTVSFTLQGFQPQAVPVTVNVMRETWDNAESGAAGEQVAIDPNPVVAILEPVPPPPPPRRRAPPKRTAAPKPKPQPAPAQPPQWGPAPPPPGFR